MTDIVERLRLGVWGRARRADAAIEANMQEGADEIERLRSELDEAIARGNDWCDQAQKARAMKERLMSAVWMIGNMDTVDDKNSWWATFGPLWHEVAKEPSVQEWANQECGLQDQMRQTLEAAYDEIEKLSSERERLLQTLEKIAGPHHPMISAVPEYSKAYDEGRESMAEIARNELYSIPQRVVGR